MKMHQYLAELDKASSQDEYDKLAACSICPVALGNEDFGVFYRVPILFAVGLMERDPRVQALAIVEVEVDLSFGAWLADNCRLEKHRMARLRSVPSSEFQPILYADSGDVGRDHLLIDGGHRYAMACHRRDPLIKARVVPENIWCAFLIEDAPKQGRSYPAERMQRDIVNDARAELPR